MQVCEGCLWYGRCEELSDLCQYKYPLDTDNEENNIVYIESERNKFRMEWASYIRRFME